MFVHFLLLDLVFDFFLRGEGERDEPEELEPEAEVLGERRRLELLDLPFDLFLVSRDEAEWDLDLDLDLERDLDLDFDRDLLDLLPVAGDLDLERDGSCRFLVAGICSDSCCT